MTKIAAEGILTCLQDAICSLEEKQVMYTENFVSLLLVWKHR